MIFSETYLKGSFIIEAEKISDERGFFARTFCQKEFEKFGLNFNFVQCNTSFNKKSGTLRGMHYQEKPFQEIKLVRCTKGKILDVIIDLRKDSDTYCKWFSTELSSENLKMLYIPKGFAHGFQTLEDKSELFYLMSEFFVPEVSKGVRWDDPVFGIKWFDIEKTISEKDMNYPDFQPNTPYVGVGFKQRGVKMVSGTL